ncbi:MAG: cation-translocating P-type ATPase [Bifidobacterium psychraerophilum]|uniref:heavy metal translocating P-type ATPase n=1 Tax=Bifidobacterium psychraerophilum TaxID=218140 RepID=UPI0039EC5443
MNRAEPVSPQEQKSPSIIHGDLPEVATPWWRDQTLLLPIASGLLWAIGLALQLRGFIVPSWIMFSIGLLAGASTFVPGTFKQLFTNRGRERLGVGLLMTISGIGAVLLGHVEEAAALAFLFSISETLEDRSMDRAKQGLRALLSLIPETAHISSATGERVIPAAQVRQDDILIVGAGERVSTDGVVSSGHSWLDTSAVTGESIPVEATPGDKILAGSVNGTGTLYVRATADGRDNSLTKIVQLVEQAQANKGTRARLADRIASPLVPAVLITAVLVIIFGFIIGNPAMWVERALVVLVAASPCALAIAVPVTVISAIASASKAGVIIKSGVAFEQLGTIRRVAFDKTGTLTRNQPRVITTVTTAGRSQTEILEWAAALETASSHPLAHAVITSVENAPGAADTEEIPGCGVSGLVNGHQIRAGSPRWIDPRELTEDAGKLSLRGMSLIIVEADGQVAGIIGIRDEPRTEAREAIRRLNDLGIETVMLTGDNTRTAEAIARETGITEVHAEQLPEDKAEYLQRSSSQIPTVMLGDGINDTPALAAATVGIAMGATGSAAAIESADVAFTGNDLRLLPAALEHARKARAIMTGNIVLALALIAALFPLALFGILGLASVVLIHEIAEVFVILNGLRAGRTALPNRTVR